MHKVEKEDIKEEVYKACKIIAWRDVYPIYNETKSTWSEKKDVICHLHYTKEFKNKVLNLGECNDGGKFTSVNQAINQAKEIVDFLNL